MLIYPKYRNFSKFSSNSGFTLVELLVVIFIATVILTTLIIQQSKWGDTLTVNTQSYELSLMLRQAQVYSLGVREDTEGNGDKFDKGYGVEVNSQIPGQYIFFADRDDDMKYDSGELIETKTFVRNVSISKVCGMVLVFGEVCSNDFLSPLRRIDVSFLRPDTSAKIKFLDSNGNEILVGPNPVYRPPAVIYLRSQNNKISSVEIDENGQISVDQ